VWFRPCGVDTRVGNFRQKNNSANDRIDGTNGYFRQNFGCTTEQKILRISLPQKRKRNSFPWNKNRSKLPEFPSLEQKIEANSRNSLLNPSAEEKTTQNSVPWNKNRSKFSEFHSESFHGRENPGK
jgi:ribosomal protein S30